MHLVTHNTLVPNIENEALILSERQGAYSKVLQSAGRILGSLPIQIAAQSGINDTFLQKLVEVEEKMNSKLDERATLYGHCVSSLVSYRNKLFRVYVSPSSYSSLSLCYDWLLAFDSLSRVRSDPSSLRQIISHFRFAQDSIIYIKKKKRFYLRIHLENNFRLKRKRRGLTSMQLLEMIY